MNLNVADIPAFGEYRASGSKSPRKSIYEKQREEEVYRNASEKGYLKTPTQELLRKHSREESLENVHYLNLSENQIHTIGNIDLCTRLRVCVLHSNFLTNFEGLISCRELVVLDLHKNQITQLPSPRFWATLSNLQVLYLHDNGISKFNTIHRMSVSPNLSVLTLHDTPVSLKPNYRHHVVNSLWSLKSLDNYVISDEEIIEDAWFGGRFASFTECFRFNSYVPLRKSMHFGFVAAEVNNLLAVVNRIQAHNSPVLMIQKMIRGYLTRARFKFYKETRLWAAISIQRFYRLYKGMKMPSEVKPPSATPMTSEDRLVNDRVLKIPSMTRALTDSRTSLALSSKDGEEDARTGEPPRMPVYEKLEEKMDEHVDSEYQIPESELKELLKRPVTVEPERKMEEEEEEEDAEKGLSVKIKTQMTIDLNKLETTAMRTIKTADSGVTIEKKMGLLKSAASRRGVSTSHGDYRLRVSHSGTLLMEKDPKPKSRGLLNVSRMEEESVKRKKPDFIGKYQTVTVFLGPILDTHPRAEKVEEEEDEEEEEVQVKFRLAGLDPPVQRTDPMTDCIQKRRNAGQVVREFLHDYERKKLTEPKKSPTKHATMSADQKMFLRTHGTMGLACLRAVEQAYRDRDRAESLASRTMNVAHMKEQREKAKERVRLYKNDYYERASKKRLRDGVKTAEMLYDREQRRRRDLDKSNMQRAVTAEHLKTRQSEFSFVNDFTCQQSSVSKALLKHDRLTQREEEISKNVGTVQRERESVQEQQALVRRFMEHRQLMRQAETAMQRSALDTKLLQEANERYLEAKSRVAQQKARTKQVQEVFPLTNTLAPPKLPPLPPLGVLAPDYLDDWQNNPPKDWTPREHNRSATEPVRRARRPIMFSYHPEVVR